MNNDNLKPFEPGKSGNPNGREKGSKNLKTILKKYLDLKSDKKDDDGNELSYYEAMALEQIKLASKGDLSAFKEIADRVEGKPAQSIDITERKPDEFEDMSQTELNEEAKRLIKEINERNPGKSSAPVEDKPSAD